MDGICVALVLMPLWYALFTQITRLRSEYDAEAEALRAKYDNMIQEKTSKTLEAASGIQDRIKLIEMNRQVAEAWRAKLAPPSRHGTQQHATGTGVVV